MDRPTAEGLLRVAEAARDSRRGGATDVDIDVEGRYPDMLTALDWYLADGRPVQAFRLASALVPFWLATSRIEDGDAWFTGALEGQADPPPRAIYDHGYLVFWAGRYELAEERFSAALAAAEAAGDPTVQALALAGSARVALNDDPARAVELLRAALAATDGTDDVAGRSSVMHVLGVALQMTGDLAGARDVMEERIRIARETGNEFVVWVESANLSMVERQLGNLDEAASLSRESLAIVHRQGDEMAIPWVLNGLAAVLAASGDLRRAATVVGAAETMLAGAGGEWPPDERQQYEGTLAILTDALPADELAAGRAAGAPMTIDEAVAFALRGEAPA